MADRTPSLLVGGLAAVAGLAALVITDTSDAFDGAVIDVVRSDEVSPLLGFLAPVTELGSTFAVTVIAVVALVLGIAVGPWRHGAIGAAVIGLSSLGVTLVKEVVARERPEVLDPLIVERGFSFPSGHATLSMVAYGILAVLVTRSFLARGVREVIVALTIAIVVLVGVSRVWLGVHFPTDVIAGWIAGGMIVLLYASLTRGVSREPAAAVVDADPAVPRSDPPAAG